MSNLTIIPRTNSGFDGVPSLSGTEFATLWSDNTSVEVYKYNPLSISIFTLGHNVGEINIHAAASVRANMGTLEIFKREYYERMYEALRTSQIYNDKIKPYAAVNMKGRIIFKIDSNKQIGSSYDFQPVDRTEYISGNLRDDRVLEELYEGIRANNSALILVNKNKFYMCWKVIQQASLLGLAGTYYNLLLDNANSLLAWMSIADSSPQVYYHAKNDFFLLNQLEELAHKFDMVQT